VGEAFRKFPWIGPWLRGGIISFIFLYKRVFYGGGVHTFTFIKIIEKIENKMEKFFRKWTKINVQKLFLIIVS